MNNSKKEAMQMRQEMKEAIKKGKACPGYNEEDADRLSDWLGNLEAKLGKASAEAIREYPDKKGFAEAYLIGLARFTATMLQRMQAEGMVTEGKNIWDAYYMAILPTTHELVMREAEELNGMPVLDNEQFAREIAEALADESLTVEQVYDKFFSNKSEDDRKRIINELRNVRSMMKDGSV